MLLEPETRRGRRPKMVPMRSVLAAQFWNEEVESTQSMEAVVRTLPGQPPPVGLQRASKLSRSQQLLLLQHLMHLPCTPSYTHDSGFVLDRVIASGGSSHWWGTITSRFRAQRLCKQSAPSDLSPLGHLARLLDGSLYALCGRARLRLGKNATLSATSELDSLADLVSAPKNPSAAWRGRLSLRHKLQGHALICEGAWHEQVVDKDACYWDIPQALSLDLASVGSRSGLRYRVGVHHSAGKPERTGPREAAKPVPSNALPGARAQAAVSYEKLIEVWSHKPDAGGRRRRKPYNLIAAQPHVTFSGIVGCLASANLTSSSAGQQFSEFHGSQQPQAQPPLKADVFASLGLSAQVGLFQRPLFDHTKVGAQIDVGTASAFAAATLQAPSEGQDVGRAQLTEDQSYPSIALTLQQQVVGPLRARVDSRFSIDPASAQKGLQMQDLAYGIDCSLEPTGAVKFVIWYSPIRREGMAEIRLFGR